jgi:rSAM/selenodomain-associated transferase 1
MSVDPGSTLLIQFARSPQPGRVKTRMMPYLTALEACELHRELVLWTSGALLRSGQGAVELAVDGAMSDPLFTRCRKLGVGRITRQSGDDLGQRMYRALHQGLAQHDKVLLVGSDCPGIDGAYLRSAVAALDSVPVVLGPAIDGGYVLIGTSEISAEVFQGIPWGSDQVYAKTIAVLERLGLVWRELPALTDIDRPEDLVVWQAAKLKSRANVDG